MRCEDVQESLAAFVLDELNDAESKEIANHVGTCERCTAEAARYRKALLALNRWEIPEHRRAPVFGPSPVALQHAKKEQPGRHRFWNIVDYGLRTAFAAAVAAAFIFGTSIHYNDGGLTINVGKVGAASVSIDSSGVASVLASAERRNVQLMSQMIEASEARQAEQYRADLSSFSRRISNQQRDYITYVMSHVYRLQQQDQLAYYQSRAALDGMVRLANAVK